MESWKGLVVIMALVGLGSLALINYAIIMQLNNGVNNTIFSNNSPLAAFNNSEFNNLNNLQGVSQTGLTNTINETSGSTPPTGALTLSSIFNILPLFSSFLTSTESSISYILNPNYMGISPIVLSELTAIFVIIILLLAWRLWKWGQ